MPPIGGKVEHWTADAEDRAIAAMREGRKAL
jgi:hypothetical protein